MNRRSNAPVTALVLAGSRGASDVMAVAAGVSHKALVPVGGVPMIVRVLTALQAARAAGRVGRILISTERADMLDLLAGAGYETDGLEILQAGVSPSASVGAALKMQGAPLFVTTADHALLKPEWIAHFLDHIPEGADIAAALARAELVIAAAPEAKRTFLRFREGAFSGCNLFYLATPEAERTISFWRKAEALRKHPFRLARRLGLSMAFRYALGLLSRQAVLERLNMLTSTKTVFVDMPYGACAIDVDKPDDLILADKIARAENI